MKIGRWTMYHPLLRSDISVRGGSACPKPGNIRALLSFGLYPVSESYALLARVGITGLAAPLMLYGAATLDLLLGMATLTMKRPRALWLAQIALIVFYTISITCKRPEYWLHP